MESSDNENSDQWIESYDSYNTEEDENDFMPSKLIKKTTSRNSKRIAISKESEDSSFESDSISSEDISKVKYQEDENKLKSNHAWADAMAKVLKYKKSLNKKTIVLSKAKKIKDIKPKKPKLDFEIVGELKEEKSDLDEIEDKKPILEKKLMMKEFQAKGRIKPSILDKDREKTLMKTATKGVVQLFNAVRQQQKTIEKTLKKSGNSERKQEKVLENIDKKKFLNTLTNSVKSIPVKDSYKSEEETEDQKKTWSALRNDFMMEIELKDWDKKE